MSSSCSTVNEKRVYDEIAYEKRVKLIQLIESGEWTIRGAAKIMDIKLCTAKYILYNYRRKGSIYGKKRGNLPKPEISEQVVEQRQPAQIVYVPIPVYIYVNCPEQTTPVFMQTYTPI